MEEMIPVSKRVICYARRRRGNEIEENFFTLFQRRLDLIQEIHGIKITFKGECTIHNNRIIQEIFHGSRRLSQDKFQCAICNINTNPHEIKISFEYILENKREDVEMLFVTKDWLMKNLSHLQKEEKRLLSLFHFGHPDGCLQSNSENGCPNPKWEEIITKPEYMILSDRIVAEIVHKSFNVITRIRKHHRLKTPS